LAPVSSFPAGSFVFQTVQSLLAFQEPPSMSKESPLPLQLSTFETSQPPNTTFMEQAKACGCDGGILSWLWLIMVHRWMMMWFVHNQNSKKTNSPTSATSLRRPTCCQFEWLRYFHVEEINDLKVDKIKSCKYTLPRSLYSKEDNSCRGVIA
jgi:hypothetical protein